MILRLTLQFFVKMVIISHDGLLLQVHPVGYNQQCKFIPYCVSFYYNIENF